MRASAVLFLLVLAAGISSPAVAQNPAAAGGGAREAPLLTGVQILSASQLKATADSMPAGAAVSHQIARFKGLSNMMSRRDTSGVPERHEHFTDIFVVERGKARLRYGGTAEGEGANGVGEWKGGTIRNGTEGPLGPGDIVVIPAGIPHQLLLAPGESFYYFVFKVPKGE